MKAKKMKRRIFQPFTEVLVPVLPGMDCAAALSMARAVGAAVRLVGLVPVPEDASLSTAAAETRTLRNTLLHMADGEFRAASRAVASYHPWQDLLDILRSSPPDLLLLEYPGHFERLGPPPPGILNQPVCDVAVVRGPWPQQIGEILVPLRGGPYAELSLRLSLALTHEHVSALHITAPSAPDFIEEPFRGLAAVLPRLRGVSLRQEPSDRPAETILQIAAAADLLLLGGSASASSPLQMGAMAERMFAEAECPTVVVKSKDPLPKTWTGLEGELAGAQAISLLVDRWFAENTYHAAEFDDTERLVRMKAEQGLTISLALPALNEEETVGQVIRTVKGRLMDEFPLLDEIVLIDSNSTDCTRQIAADLGVPVYIHQELLPELGSRRGKGEALWKSLLVTRGDILVWIDTDIVNIHPRFVSGVIGPLLANPALQFVKGFYRRPLREGGQTLAGGGGRVTELTARPLLNLFYPELSGVVQPLSGEYGGRRKALEQVPFFSGYGVEIGMLIDIFDKFGLSAIAQVDLLERVHHNQSLEALSKMSFTILQAVLRKLERRYNRSILEEVNKSMKLIRYEEGGYYLDVEEVAERERPPMITLTEYLEKS